MLSLEHSKKDALITLPENHSASNFAGAAVTDGPMESEGSSALNFPLLLNARLPD
jgi:hypothetical protein